MNEYLCMTEIDEDGMTQTAYRREAQSECEGNSWSEREKSNRLSRTKRQAIPKLHP